MESAAEAALSSVFTQLGAAGVILAAVIALGVWWVRASKDLRDEKETAIARKDAEIAKLHERLVRVTKQRDEYRESYFELKFPGYTRSLPTGDTEQ